MQNVKVSNRNFYIFLGACGSAVVALGVLAPTAFKVLALSFGLAYLLDPAVDWLEHRKVSRSLSIISILVVAITVMIILISLIIPYLWDQTVDFVEAAPELVQKALDKLDAWSVLPKEFTITLPQLAAQAKEKLLAEGINYLSPIAQGLFRATSGILGIILTIVNFVIVPVFFFYILRDLEGIKKSFFRFVPESLQDRVSDYVRMIDGVLGGFIRGQIVVALALAVLYSAGLLITGLRFGVIIGVAAGILSVIPYVGFFVGILVSSVIVLVDFSGWGMVIGVAATFGVSQVIEGYILTPKLVGNKVGLNPLETLIAVLVGGEVGGIVGLLIAIPTGGIAKKTLYELRPVDEKIESADDNEQEMNLDMEE